LTDPDLPSNLVVLSSIPCLLATGFGVALGPGWRITLLALIGLLLLALGFLIAYVAIVRRRPPAPAPRFSPPPPVAEPRIARAPVQSPAPRPSGSQGGLAIVVGEAPSISGPMSCPSCRRDFDAGIRFCPHDARKLVPKTELLRSADLLRATGSVCPRCRRAYEAGVRACPHDAEDLIPIGVWEATRGRRPFQPPTGVVAKICPQCAGRYDLASTFCVRDGVELVTIN
jgi:hypothetical protein